MKAPEVSEVSKGVKRGYDSRGVKSVTPYRGTLTPDTLSDSPEVSRGSDTPPGYHLELKPASGNWRTPPLLRLRALLKAALRGYGMRCVSAVEHQAPVPPPPPTPLSGNNAGMNQERIKE
jgi:hypothetical protein